MLAESINELKQDANIDGKQSGRSSDQLEPKIDFPFDAFLPGDYIEGAEQRLDIYKRLSEAENRDILKSLIDETVDRYGSPPIQAQSLFDLIELKLGCVRAGLTKLELYEDYLTAEFFSQNGDDWHDRLNNIVNKWHELPIEFSGSDPVKILIRWGAHSQWDDRIIYVKDILGRID